MEKVSVKFSNRQDAKTAKEFVEKISSVMKDVDIQKVLITLTGNTIKVVMLEGFDFYNPADDE